MAQPIYKFFMARFSEAWYQLSEEEQNSLVAKFDEFGRVGCQVSQPVFRTARAYLQRINMRLSPRVAVALCLSGLLCGCSTTQELLTKVQNVAAVVFNNPSVGAYRATPQQVRLADQRATDTFDQLSLQDRDAFKKSETRYLAVRTSDPTPTQRAEIRRNMKKPGSKYFGATKAPGRIYCVMIWDTQSREIVGTDCYAVLDLPTPGTLVRLDTFTAQYVGDF